MQVIFLLHKLLSLVHFARVGFRSVGAEMEALRTEGSLPPVFLYFYFYFYLLSKKRSCGFLIMIRKGSEVVDGMDIGGGMVLVCVT